MTAALLAGWAIVSQPAQAQDRLYQSDEPDMAEFSGRPMWTNAARCAAYEDEIAASAVPPEMAPGMPEADRLRQAAYHRAIVDGARKTRAFWTRFGVMRLERDRPGQAAGGVFEAQVAIDLAEHRRLARTDADRDAFEARCSLFRSGIEWNLVRMQRGWADQ